MVFSPGPLDDAPQSFIATARTDPREEAGLERAVTDAFPNVSAIGVKDALATLGNIVAAIATAVTHHRGRDARRRRAGPGRGHRRRSSPPRL